MAYHFITLGQIDMTRGFYTLDVFTEEAFSGNPLAVVLDCEGLTDETMQSIAAEFNLSETVFVFPPTDDSTLANIRIFTPVHELPFAGHPTIGTAVLLNHLNYYGAGDEFVLQEKVGPVSCTIHRHGEKPRASFELPQIAFQREWEFDATALCEALNIDVAQLDAEKVEIWDGGVPYIMVPVLSLDAVKEARANAHKIGQIEPSFNGISSNPYVFFAGGTDPVSDYYARMFAPNFGIPEDPATGSAAASMSGWIAKYEMEADASRQFKIEQGYDMGRPSQIYLDISKQNGSITRGAISGTATFVSQGVLFI